MDARLELDDDVMTQLRATMRQSGRSLTEVVNGLLRDAFGSRKASRAAVERRTFEVKARPMGLHPKLDYRRISELLEQLEGPCHR